MALAAALPHRAEAMTTSKTSTNLGRRSCFRPRLGTLLLGFSLDFREHRRKDRVDIDGG
ncbi:MAG TPA: hypothetical protein VIY28_08920 [Pseudonocardiaceae bacterium]